MRLKFVAIIVARRNVGVYSHKYCILYLCTYVHILLLLAVVVVVVVVVVVAVVALYLHITALQQTKISVQFSYLDPTRNMIRSWLVIRKRIYLRVEYVVI